MFGKYLCVREFPPDFLVMSETFVESEFHFEMNEIGFDFYFDCGRPSNIQN